jgi:hypothetical protein
VVVVAIGTRRDRLVPRCHREARQEIRALAPSSARCHAVRPVRLPRRAPSSTGSATAPACQRAQVSAPCGASPFPHQSGLGNDTRACRLCQGSPVDFSWYSPRTRGPHLKGNRPIAGAGDHLFAWPILRPERRSSMTIYKAVPSESLLQSHPLPAGICRLVADSDADDTPRPQTRQGFLNTNSGTTSLTRSDVRGSPL